MFEIAYFLMQSLVIFMAINARMIGDAWSGNAD